MPTKNKRVAAYLPSDVEKKFEEYKEQNSIDGSSEALIKILRDYLGVVYQEPEVSYLQLPDLLKRVEALESVQFVTQEQFSELREEVVKNIAMAFAKSSHNQRGELNGVSESEPLQKNLAIDLNDGIDGSIKTNNIPLDLVNGLSQTALAKRLGVDRKKIGRRKDNDDFPKWSSEIDPDGFSWQYGIDDKKYYLIG